MFRLGRPETAGQWAVHVILAIVALAMVGWMIRAFIL
jgi:hypothetical protein